jgi:hypothetical protein
MNEQREGCLDSFYRAAYLHSFFYHVMGSMKGMEWLTNSKLFRPYRL